MNYAGRHCYADATLHTWPGDDAILHAAERAIKASGMNVIATTYKRFDPHGLTAVWILAESHFTVHTYPEHRYISADCYTCGDEGNPSAAISALLAGLGVDRSTVGEIPRGELL